MLAMEEKKSEAMSVTLHDLKHDMLYQGVDTGMVESVWNKLKEDGTINPPYQAESVPEDGPLETFAPRYLVANQWGRGHLQLNFNEAMAKMSKEFSAHKMDIIECFADADGNVPLSMSIESFCRGLYEVTEGISKRHIQSIAIRFCDETVTSTSVPEFFQYFLVTPKVP